MKPITLVKQTEGTTLSTRSKPSPFRSRGLEIMLKAKLIIDEKHGDILKHLRELIEENYDADINDTEKKEEEGDIEVEIEEEFDIADIIFIDDDEDNNKE